jgi:hypothetical protein
MFYDKLYTENKKTCFKAGFSIYKIKNLNVQISHQHPASHGLNI